MSNDSVSNNNKSTSSSGGGSKGNSSWKNEGKSFKGQCSELEGSTIDINGNGISQYNETMKMTLNHIDRECQQGFCVKKLLVNLELEEPPHPEAPGEDLDEDDVEHQMCQEEIKNFVRERRKCKENMRQAHSLTLGQCSQAVEVKIRSFPEHECVEENEDSIGLLKILNELMHEQEVKTSIKLSLCGQGDKSLHQHSEEFKNTIEQAEGCGIQLGNETKVRKHPQSSGNKVDC